MTSLIGQTLNKRYRLEALLGDGGMGTVYRGSDLNLERQVAIKLMHSHFARQEEFRARLVQEARTSAQLDHPSIVRVYDFGDSELGLFIAMEYVDGGSLRDHLRRLGQPREPPADLDGRGTADAGIHLVEHEGRDGIDRRDDDREVLGRAARHHGIYGDAIDARRAESRRQVRHDLVPRPARPGEHPLDALDRRGHNRQAVAPAALEIEPVDRFDVVRRLEQGGALVTGHWFSA